MWGSSRSKAVYVRKTVALPGLATLSAVSSITRQPSDRYGHAKTCCSVCLPSVLCPQAQEALRRAKFKFPGRQKIITSRNWGFTNFVRDDFIRWRKEGRLLNDGVNARLITNK